MALGSWMGWEDEPDRLKELIPGMGPLSNCRRRTVKVHLLFRKGWGVDTVRNSPAIWDPLVGDDWSCMTFVNGSQTGYNCTGVKGHCGCMHAEMRAFGESIFADEPLVLVCDYSPCSHCANLFARFSPRVEKFLFWDYAVSKEEGSRILQAAGFDIRPVGERAIDWKRFQKP